MGGLASENVRWAESVENYRSQGVTLCGDVLLISAFVSYVGYFTKKYRNELMDKFWIPYVNTLQVRGSSLGKGGVPPQGGPGQVSPSPPRRGRQPQSRDRGQGGRHQALRPGIAGGCPLAGGPAGPPATTDPPITWGAVVRRVVRPRHLLLGRSPSRSQRAWTP